MGENSKIEWTDHTFNPWIGCTKVSPGCKNCYAENLDLRWNYTPNGWGKGAPRKRTSKDYWKQPAKWNEQAVKVHRRKRVFCASLADVFDPEVNEVWRDDLFQLIAETQCLDWLILTKHPQEAVKYFENLYTDPFIWQRVKDILWIGVSVEDQKRAKERIPWLKMMPVAVRFLSIEPLLEHVNIMPWLLHNKKDKYIDWVIVGGESGKDARPMHYKWAANLRDQCADTHTPFFFKQWGEYAPDMKRVGKKKAGRELDGRSWDQIPKLT